METDKTKTGVGNESGSVNEVVCAMWLTENEAVAAVCIADLNGCPPKLLLPPQPSTGIELKEELERTFDLILKQISVAVGIPERLLSPNQKGKNEREKT